MADPRQEYFDQLCEAYPLLSREAVWQHVYGGCSLDFANRDGVVVQSFAPAIPFETKEVDHG